MNLLNWNKMQVDEAIGSVNRYFFWLQYQRDPFDDNELLLFYVEQGGAKNFADNHKQEKPNVKK